MVPFTTKDGIFLVAGAVACSLYLCYRWLLCKPILGIVYNKDTAFTLFGDLPNMLKAVNETGSMVPWIVSNNQQHNSPLVQLCLRPFCGPIVVLADFRESHDILIRRTKEFDRSSITGDVFVGLGPEMHLSFQSNDPRFKPHKGLLKDLMTPAFLNKVAAPIVYASATNLINIWSTKACLAQEKAFDAFENNASAILDAISAISFGLDLDEGILVSQMKHLSQVSYTEITTLKNAAIGFEDLERPAVFQALLYLLGTIEDTTKSVLPLLFHWYLRKTPRYREAYDMKEGMIRLEIDKAIRRIEQENLAQRCAIDYLLHRELMQAQKTGRKPKYHSRAIYDESLGFLLGGFDTTSSTLAWLWKYLTTEQEVQKTLREILRNAYPQATAEHRNPTIDEIIKTNIPYLDATIEENHRCAAIIGMAFRRALVDTTILGHPIKKGTDVCMVSLGPGYTSPPIEVSEDQRSDSSRAAKQNVGSWDLADMHSFKPERWLKFDDNGEKVFNANAGPMLAFAAGPRGCFGRRLAYLQVRIILVMVLWNFQLLEVHGELGSFKSIEKLSRIPVHCYLRLKKVEA